MGMNLAPPGVMWPEGKRFAFTIVDDTDGSTVDNVEGVYDFLHERGFRTTKTVWPLSPLAKPFVGGDSLEDPDYRRWVLGLRDKGFEIALHGVADEASRRERVKAGLDDFRDVIGHDPTIHVNHYQQSESVYWGRDRLDGLPRWLYEAAWRLARRRWDGGFGHVEGSPYFWGDLCHDRITYVRNFVFEDINTLKMDPLMPYHDPRRPHVRYWFSSSNGSAVEPFCRLISEENQDRLMREGGACIVYTHFGVRFSRGGVLDPTFVRLMSRLSDLPGWFVPASTLLGHLGEQRRWRSARDHGGTINRMQWRWLIEKLGRGGSQ